MEKLRQAVIGIVQEEADTWATLADLKDLNDSHRIHQLVTAFNEIAPADQQINLTTDVNWH